MMHPDHFNFIIIMMKAFIIASIAIYAFKSGVSIHHMIELSDF